MKVSFSLAKSKTKNVGTAPPLRQPAAFAAADDEPIDAAPTASSSGHAEANKRLAAQTAALSKTQKRRMEQELKVDNTVFEYDEVWDKMQEAKQKQKESKEVEAKVRKPKYINNLLQSAATRRLDYLRAEEKTIQRERDAEGDEFADKEQFVTQAYKDQMAEVRRAEEEEKRREELEKSKKKVTTGMTHFYRQLLEQSEEQHNATVAAVEGDQKTVGPLGPSAQNLTITRPPDFTPKSDLEIAQEARAEGKDIELNDDNQIVDKRELLSAGLNLSLPNTRRLGGLRTSSSKPGVNGGKDEPVLSHRAVGSAASRKEINERRMREIEQQLMQEEDRVKAEKEREERERMERIIAKRNTEEDVKSAQQRYLERKRRRLEEATAQSEEMEQDP